MIESKYLKPDFIVEERRNLCIKMAFTTRINNQNYLIVPDMYQYIFWLKIPFNEKLDFCVKHAQALIAEALKKYV